ncbi:MAG TPA: ferrous iron transporter B, partial [Candidatus Acetothermia bacterium]|nr:ferrous iron transporter B [Candidatus Acetothermia bacterium]
MLTNEEILRAKDRALAHLRSIYGDDAETIIADRRYGFISGVLKDVVKKPAIERLAWSDKIDRVIVNRWLGIPIFLAVMYGMFQFTFTLSAPLMDWISAGFDFIAVRAVGISPEWLGSLIGNGIIGGVGTV